MYVCKFKVDIPIHVGVIAVQTLENPYIYIAVTMLVGKRMPTIPFSHVA